MMNVQLGNIELKNPVIPASGTCGFGLEMSEWLDLNSLGAISTKGTTREARYGNPVPRIAECGTTGMLNAVGLQNPGVGSAEISTARNVAMFILRDYLELKYEKIGQIFGGRKHTTVMHGCDNVDEDKDLKKQAEEIYKLIT